MKRAAYWLVTAAWWGSITCLILCAGALVFSLLFPVPLLNVFVKDTAETFSLSFLFPYPVDSWQMYTLVYGNLILILVNQICMIQIFDNLHLMLKPWKEGKNFSREDSPFDQKNVLFMKKIAFCALAMPLINLTAQLILSGMGLKSLYSFNMTSLAMGIAALYLWKIFAYGCDLQQENDGYI